MAGAWFSVHVSTHSRPKAAERRFAGVYPTSGFQHTAARRRLRRCFVVNLAFRVSTHSRPKAADHHTAKAAGFAAFQHTAARRRLVLCIMAFQPLLKFQHTAARRRLIIFYAKKNEGSSVSTHSRPKAAAYLIKRIIT